MHTLVDGYNVLYAMPEFHGEEVRRDIERGRALLVDKMMRYSKASGEKVTVVFDAPSASGGTSKDRGGTRVVFSGDADAFIAKTVKRWGASKGVRVATSDRRLRAEIKRLGAECEGARRFLSRAEEAVKSVEAGQERLRDLTEEEIEDWLREFGFRKGKDE